MKKPVKFAARLIDYEEDNYFSGWNEACDEWQKYFDWYIKEHCVKKENLPDVEEIFKIVFDNINEKDIRPVAQAIAKRIRGE